MIYSKGEKTQLQFVIEPNSTITGLLPHEVRTQYKRYSQDYTVVLVRQDNPDEPYLAVGKHSTLLSESGMSFLIEKPSGIPGIMPFIPWVSDFKAFLRKTDKYFEGDDFEYVRNDWRSFAYKYLPTLEILLIMFMIMLMRATL